MFRFLGRSKIAFLLAILFGISLFFFRGGSRYSNFFNSDAIVATVSNTPISTSKFNRSININIQKFNEIYGKQMSSDEIKGAQIHFIALGALINDAIFEDEYDLIKFKLDEKVIALKTKERIPKLYDSNNKLNEAYLKSILQQQQLKIEDIVQIINFETRDEYFSNAFFNVNYPNYFSDQINSVENQEREISYIELQISKITNDEIMREYFTKSTGTALTIEGLKEQAKNYYTKNIQNYSTQETRKIEYLRLDKNKIKINLIPTNFEIKEYYDLNKKLFLKEEKRSFLQFNFKSMGEAEKFKNETNGLDINKIIDYSNNNNLKFNKFNDLGASQILEQISIPLFKLNINEKSDILETPLAKHIVILKSITPAYQQTLNETNNKIKETIAKIETDNYYNDISSKISEQILNGENINNISKMFNLKIEIIENLTRDYTNFDLSEQLFFSSLISSSFNSNKDFLSDLIYLDDDQSYIFNIPEIKLPLPIDLSLIESEVENDFLMEKKIEKILKETEENIDNANYVDGIAQKYKLKTQNSKVSKTSKEIPIQVINNIFNSNKKNNIQFFYDDRFYIVRIDDVLIPDTENQINRISLSNDLKSSFSQEILENKKIDINDELISAIIDQY